MRLKCGHHPWASQVHCANMTCSNYINKCPVHGISTIPKAECSSKEKEKPT